MEPTTNLLHEATMLVTQLGILVVAIVTLIKTMKANQTAQDTHKAVNGRMDALLAETERRARLEGKNEGVAGQPPASVPDTASTTPQKG